ncbi:MAG: hypothetical protein ACD_3C00047G0001 [uncultured bacterium (gcode 4)]|uniref:Uncharacterized protein n=1 Tax=uncultured bacterium (gcode 4) TaxID=1234023 RepID=K2GYN2_9BACT|nr:MAG: hypothetical protein ACD_3C00047G0001 [uncultured bacterium (gcode 4)]
MKTKIFKQVWMSILSVLIVSWVAFAASISDFTNTSISDNTIISKEWYNLANKALSTIFDINWTLKDWSIPASKVSETNGKWCKSDWTKIVCNQEAPTGWSTTSNYEYRLVWTSTNTIGCYYIPSSTIVDDNFCTKDLAWWLHSSKECVLLGRTVEQDADLWLVCTSTEKSYSYCYYGLTLNVWEATSACRRDSSGYYWSTGILSYDKYINATTKITSTFEYAWKSKTIATNKTYNWCIVASSHSYWIYSHPSNEAITNFKYPDYTVTPTTYKLKNITYWETLSPLYAESCLAYSPAWTYSSTAFWTVIDNVSWNLVNSNYVSKIALK